MHYVKIFGQEKQVNTMADPAYYYLEDALGWDRETSELFLKTHLHNIYREIRPKEQAAEVINRLKENHELVLITSRNVHIPLCEELTLNWLQENSIEYDRIILNSSSNMHYFDKLEVCRQQGVQLMVEDHYDVAELLSPTIPVILFDYPYNRHVSAPNIMRVSSWAEVLAWVEHIASR
jgi:uncharacterized HAD superfamily protein